MPRRKRVVPTDPGQGMMAIQTPLAALLEARCGIDQYLQLVRGGQLDPAERNYKFNSTPGEIASLRERGRDLPDDLPDMHGDVNWHRDDLRWSLHANHCQMTPEMLFWSSVRKGISAVRIDGVRIPDTVIDNLVGRKLREVIDHPFLADPEIIIVNATSGGPYPSLNGISPGRPAMTTFQITVPVIVVPDPLPKSEASFTGEKYP